MADEWNAKGWTAAMPSTVVGLQDPDLVVPLPTDIDQVTIFGDYRFSDNGRPTGYLMLTASVDTFIHVVDGDIFDNNVFTAAIQYDGTLRLSVPATDTAAFTPTNFEYNLLLVVANKVIANKAVVLPKATVVVNLSDLLLGPAAPPLPPPTGTVSPPPTGTVPRGTVTWFSHGQPGTIIGSQPGDYCIDMGSPDYTVYTLGA